MPRLHLVYRPTHRRRWIFLRRHHHHHRRRHLRHRRHRRPHFRHHRHRRRNCRHRLHSPSHHNNHLRRNVSFALCPTAKLRLARAELALHRVAATMGTSLRVTRASTHDQILYWRRHRATSRRRPARPAVGDGSLHHPRVHQPSRFQPRSRHCALAHLIPYWPLHRCCRQRRQLGRHPLFQANKTKSTSWERT